MMLLMMMMLLRPWRLQHRRIEGEDSTGAEIEEGAQEGSTGAERSRKRGGITDAKWMARKGQQRRREEVKSRCKSNERIEVDS